MTVEKLYCVSNKRPCYDDIKFLSLSQAYIISKNTH